jgi:hypothetical protein
MALGLGLLCWIALLFSPLAFVQTAQADETDSYGTVIGIVRTSHQALQKLPGPSQKPVR